MQTTLVAVGLLCLVAAIVGGGVRMAGGEIPILTSVARQFLLAAFGACLLVWSANLGEPRASAPDVVSDNTTDLTLPPTDMAAANEMESALPSSSADDPSNPTPAPSATQPAVLYTDASLARADAAVDDLKRQISESDALSEKQVSAIARQNDLIVRQEQNLDSGAGTPELRQEVRTAIQEARDGITAAQDAIDRWKLMRPQQQARLKTLSDEADRIREWLAQHKDP